MYNAQVCRFIKKLEPIVADLVSINQKQKTLQGRYRSAYYRCYSYKNAKYRKVSFREKDHNTLLAKTRIKVEHVIRTFNILSHRYRNKRERYHIKFNIIAGIVNLNHGFSLLSFITLSASSLL
ncbi:MAG: transposase, IS4 family protein [Candidatus Xenolissoclinum pacificiensis L6]|uniref:Transposase, IS4 family protein n=1 Tax=Candidatus Xenolissoclinum pacificiensis L6 TaxID=1401685 RepID=W2V2Q8_9RICK|nr:MAG: transposase, IS4 family protein [Candidatus Xenolissoclinum pacificiensis L6]